jgi:Ca2+-binding RTX toxin-like protein
MSTTTTLHARFHHAIETTPGQLMLMGFWTTEPASSVDKYRVTFGDGQIFDWSAGDQDPVTVGNIFNTYTLDDRILDVYNIGVRAELVGGGVLTQQARLIADMGFADGRNLRGTNFSDAIVTGAGDDTVNGYAGHDLISSGEGNDLVNAGTGDDWVDGGAGNDTIQGGDGINNLFGGSGADLLVGGAGLDYLIGDDWGVDGFADTLNGGAGNDDLFGNGGNDLLLGGTGDDYLDGGDGDDRMFGQAGNDGFFGGAGNDSMVGDIGDDYLDGGEGNDTINGGAGADTVRGGAGADLVRLGANDGAADVLIYGPGTGGDRVFDFNPVHDVIAFEGIAPIPEARFVVGDGARAPAGAGPALLYDTATDRLWLDMDGRGGMPPELVAVFVGGPALTYESFIWL